LEDLTVHEEPVIAALRVEGFTLHLHHTVDSDAAYLSVAVVARMARAANAAAVLHARPRHERPRTTDRRSLRRDG